MFVYGAESVSILIYSIYIYIYKSRKRERCINNIHIFEFWNNNFTRKIKVSLKLKLVAYSIPSPSSLFPFSTPIELETDPSVAEVEGGMALTCSGIFGWDFLKVCAGDENGTALRFRSITWNKNLVIVNKFYSRRLIALKLVFFLKSVLKSNRNP